MAKKKSTKIANRDFSYGVMVIFISSLLSFLMIVFLDLSLGLNQFGDAVVEVDGKTIDQRIQDNWIIFVVLLVIVGFETVLQWVLALLGADKVVETFKRKVLMYNSIDRKGEKNPNKKGTFEMWTIRHFIGSGIIALFIPGYTLPFMIGSVAFEWVERTTSHNSKIYAYRKEPLGNQLLDIIANTLGYLTGTYLSGLLGHPLAII